MPSSSLLAAPMVIHYVWQVQQQIDHPLRILDVGPGWGKYERLLREYVEPDLHIAAIEAWGPYIRDFDLKVRYDHMIEGDILDQTAEVLGDYDLILMVDVIEHLPKPESLLLLERIPGWVVICTPRDFFHNPARCPPTEKHVSHWAVADFKAMPRFDVYARKELAEIGAVIVRMKPS